MYLNRTGPPMNRGVGRATGPNVNRTGPVMNTALGRLRRSRLHRATPKRGPIAPSRPV